MNEESAAELLSLASRGQLMTWLAADELGEEERLRAIDCLVGLHQTKQIDVFRYLDRPSEAEEWMRNFSSWISVYKVLIPRLDDPADKVISAITLLSSGYWGHFLSEAFLGWCKNDRSRIDEVLALEVGTQYPEFFFAAALIAGLQIDPQFYIDEAILYASGQRGSRMPGIRAIAMMSVQDDMAIRAGVEALSIILSDDEVVVSDRADALSAALDVAQRFPGMVDGLVSSMVTAANNSKEAALLHACCHFLTRAGRDLHLPLLPSLLLSLQNLDIDASENNRTVDLALYVLLTNGRRVEAIDCLEVLLRKSAISNPLEALQSTVHHLVSAETPFLFQVVCRWLLDGDRKLCASVRHFVLASHNQKFTFSFDPGNKGWPETRTLYLARKAIGWLMPHATAPVSFLVCIMEAADEDARRGLCDLIFDPILVNYPVAARSYLESVIGSLSPGAEASVRALLERHSAYRDAVDAVGFVPELQPTDRQRQIEAQRQAEKWGEAHRAARDSSPLLSMVNHQTILYGVKTVSYVEDLDGTIRRLENRLHTVSYTADNAMGWIYDPFGLDFTLRMFRAERSPK